MSESLVNLIPSKKSTIPYCPPATSDNEEDSIGSAHGRTCESTGTAGAPPEVASTVRTPIHGKPDMTRVSTSHVERQNLSIRMGMRRMTRLTNAFSKKWENLRAAYALWFAFFNFCRVHKTLRVTPAMEAGMTSSSGF